MSLEKFFIDEFLFNEERLPSWVLKDVSCFLDRGCYIFKKRRVERIIERSEAGIEDFQDRVELYSWYFRFVSSCDFPLWLKLIILRCFKGSEYKVGYFSYADLLSDGWSVEDVVLSSLSLSSENIGGYDIEDDDFSYWLNLRKSNIDLFCGAVFLGDIVGQAGFVRLSEVDYDLLISGNFDERKINFNQDASCNYLYIPSVVVVDGFRNSLILRNILTDLINKAVVFCGSGSIRYICANAYSDKGEALCKRLGLKYIIKNIDGGSVYSGSIKSFIGSDFYSLVADKIFLGNPALGSK